MRCTTVCSAARPRALLLRQRYPVGARHGSHTNDGTIRVIRRDMAVHQNVVPGAVGAAGSFDDTDALAAEREHRVAETDAEALLRGIEGREVLVDRLLEGLLVGRRGRRTGREP